MSFYLGGYTTGNSGGDTPGIIQQSGSKLTGGESVGTTLAPVTWPVVGQSPATSVFPAANVTLSANQLTFTIADAGVYAISFDGFFSAVPPSGSNVVALTQATGMYNPSNANFATIQQVGNASVNVALTTVAAFAAGDTFQIQVSSTDSNTLQTNSSLLITRVA